MSKCIFCTKHIGRKRSGESVVPLTKKIYDRLMKTGYAEFVVSGQLVHRNCQLDYRHKPKSKQQQGIRRSLRDQTSIGRDEDLNLNIFESPQKLQKKKCQKKMAVSNENTGNDEGNISPTPTKEKTTTHEKKITTTIKNGVEEEEEKEENTSPDESLTTTKTVENEENEPVKVVNGEKKESVRVENGEEEESMREEEESMREDESMREEESVREEESMREEEESTREDSAQKESTREESVGEDTAQKESVGEKSAQKESVREKHAQKESVREKHAQKESVGEKHAQKESVREKHAQKESVGEEHAQKESVGEENTTKKSAQKESMGEESPTESSPLGIPTLDHIKKGVVRVNGSKRNRSYSMRKRQAKRKKMSSEEKKKKKKIDEVNFSSSDSDDDDEESDSDDYGGKSDINSDTSSVKMFDSEDGSTDSNDGKAQKNYTPKSVVVPTEGRSRSSRLSTLSSPIKNTDRGRIIWGTMSGYKAWPGIIISHEDCGMKQLTDKAIIYFFGDHTVDEVLMKKIDDFLERTPNSTTDASLHKAVVEGLQELRHQSGLEEMNSEEDLLEWRQDGCQGYKPFSPHTEVQMSARTVRGLMKIQLMADSNWIEYLTNTSSIPKGHATKQIVKNWGPKVRELNRVKTGKEDLEDVCIACHQVKCEVVGHHPFFLGGLCHLCLVNVTEAVEAYNNDNDNVERCSVCGSPGDFLGCDLNVCKRLYCIGCISLLVGPKAVKHIEKMDPWPCFYCNDSDSGSHCLIKPRRHQGRKRRQQSEGTPSSSSPSVDVNSRRVSLRGSNLKNTEHTPKNTEQNGRDSGGNASTPKNAEHTPKNTEQNRRDNSGGASALKNNTEQNRRDSVGGASTLKNAEHTLKNTEYTLRNTIQNGRAKVVLRSSDYGRVVWATMTGWTAWPALIVSPASCGMSDPPTNTTWVYWYGDHTVKDLHMRKIKDFLEVPITMRPYKKFHKAVLESLEELRHQAHLQKLSPKALLEWGQSGCQGGQPFIPNQEAKLCARTTRGLMKILLMSGGEDNMGFLCNISNDDDSNPLKGWSPKARELDQVRAGELSIEDVCIACHSIEMNMNLSPHPYFFGGICDLCQLDVGETGAASHLSSSSSASDDDDDDDDDSDSYCSVCGSPGEILGCDNDHCSRSYCTGCISLLVRPEAVKDIKEKDPWACFLCDKFKDDTHGLLKPRDPEDARRKREQTKEMQTKSVKNTDYGRVVWGTMSGHKPWPAVIVNHEDCGVTYLAPDKVYLYWFGEHNVIEVAMKKVKDFCEVVMMSTPDRTIRKAILESLEELRHQAQLEKLNPSALVEWGRKGCKGYPPYHLRPEKTMSPRTLRGLMKIQLMSMDDISLSSFSDTSASNSLRGWEPKVKQLDRVRAGQCDIEDVCIACHQVDCPVVERHPFFFGGLCELCQVDVEEVPQGSDRDEDINPYCTVCGSRGEVFICDETTCERSYCAGCVSLLVSPEALEEVREADPWHCFLCVYYHPNTHGLLKPRDREEQRGGKECSAPDPSTFPGKPLRVISLFDGISTGLFVLRQLKFKIETYYSSEIDEDALNVQEVNHGPKVIPIGDVTKFTNEQIEEICPIDLLIGGSPCNDLCFVNPYRKGLWDSAGSGRLFFHYYRFLMQIQQYNKHHHLFWLFENVVNMPKEYSNDITTFFGCEPKRINAENFSPQRRVRHFWGNLPGMHRRIPRGLGENIHLKDCIENLNGRTTNFKKVNCITTKPNSQMMCNNSEYPVRMKERGDLLWSTEMERLFGFPPHYTDVGNLNASKRQALLGRSWSVPVIKYLLTPLTAYYPTNDKPQPLKPPQPSPPPPPPPSRKSTQMSNGEAKMNREVGTANNEEENGTQNSEVEMDSTRDDNT
ncbi:hypothetical protein Pmani_037032 [Petrolisthes manimaculis]|uniref:DNA (cytosine-5-)-methyltransferase n=1 Tax=Petrolisthes manimaculis TaxID=1843537 RepID=A0AAE1NJZ4_9EUCA|nr:hypothetical protein Pmani_037032 [Petrolisthes manimaculis]